MARSCGGEGQDHSAVPGAVTDDWVTVLERGSHPLGVRPWGDAIASGTQTDAAKARRLGLGELCALDDGALLKVLGYLDARSLAQVGLVSRVLFAFSSEEDLWRRHVLSRGETVNMLGSSWKETFIHGAWQRRGKLQVEHGRYRSLLKLGTVYSDTLFHSWRCASAGISPEWLRGDDVKRVALNDISEKKFAEQFDRPNIPVVLTGWKPLEGGTWNREWLLSDGNGDRTLNAGGFSFTLKGYFEYLDSAVDDQPLYLFDKRFGEAAPRLAGAYEAPSCFGTDLFSFLPSTHHPDWRWLIIGGRRSGSSFHKDPNGTSAWNAVVRGSKRWLMLPPSAGPPPGVRPSADGASVTAPLSPVEWFLNFFHLIRDNPRLVRCTTVAGEVLYVPHGWWHTVLNLEETVALTQNFVTRHDLPHVLRLLREHPDHLSGVQVSAQELDAALCDSLRRERPEILEEAESELQKGSLWDRLSKRPRLEARGPDSRTSQGSGEGGSSFKFGFA